MINSLVTFIRDTYKTNEVIGLHEPSFNGNELSYVTEAIKSTYVSSVGKFVDEFEKGIERYTASPGAVSTVNGTAALHASMYVAGVKSGEAVITQALTFVATCNAIYHMGAQPIFVDVSKSTMGLCPKALESFLEENAVLEVDGSFLKSSKKRIRAVIPMHTYGHPVELDEIVVICKKWKLVLIEDAAESLGSFYKGRHTGTIGDFGAISFNGNKVITTGGGGMVLCGSEDSKKTVKHVTTTAKVAHPYEFFHDCAGFNYRMPNLNAALGVGQLESLNGYLLKKRDLAMHYKAFFKDSDYSFFDEPINTQSNFWLNTIVCPDLDMRNELLDKSNAAGIMMRPVWTPMHKLPIFQDSPKGNLTNTDWFESRVVNIPSSPIEFSNA
ncbi:LegC family aminotransferase [Gammaproteobacteria bacterium]|nr:LegC family aminotransferase [Gammaproteobacteria bacterium]MDC0090015.1 LegC family aminotransferase [Gammaproteobacteria bacterium]